MQKGIALILAIFVAIQLGGLFSSTSAYAQSSTPPATTSSPAASCPCPATQVKTKSCCEIGIEALKKAKRAAWRSYKNSKRIKKIEAKIAELDAAVAAAKKAAEDAKGERKLTEELIKRIAILEARIHKKLQELEGEMKAQPSPSTPAPETQKPVPTPTPPASVPGPTSGIEGWYAGAFVSGHTNFDTVGGKVWALQANPMVRYVSSHHIGIQFSGGLGMSWYGGASPFMANARAELQGSFGSIIAHIAGQFNYFSAPYKGETNYIHGLIDVGATGRFGNFEIGGAVGGAFHSERPDHAGIWLMLRLGFVLDLGS